MLREALSNTYREEDQDLKSNDVKITRNQEINMGNEADEENQHTEERQQNEGEDEEEIDNHKFIKIDVSKVKNQTLQKIQKKEFKQKRGQQQIVEKTPKQNTTK